MDKGRSFGDGESNHAVDNSAESHYQLLALLLNRFGEQSFRFPVSAVVSDTSYAADTSN